MEGGSESCREDSEWKGDRNLVSHHCLSLLSCSLCLCNRIIRINSRLLWAEAIVLILRLLLLLLRGHRGLGNLVLLPIFGPDVLLALFLLLVKLGSLLLLLLDCLLSQTLLFFGLLPALSALLLLLPIVPAGHLWHRRHEHL